MAETTLADLIAAVADAWGHYRTGTAGAGSDATTIIDALNLRETDGYWVGHYVHILSGAQEGLQRGVVAYRATPPTLTVQPAFNGTTEAADYELLALPREAIIRAINEAIRTADVWFRHVTDTNTIDLDTEVHVHDLPAGTVSVAQVWLRPASDSDWREIRPNHWHVLGNKLYLMGLPSLSGTVRLEYLARINELEDDADVLGLGAEHERECVSYIVNYALHWLYTQQSSHAPTADSLRSYITLAEYKREAAAQIKRRAGSRTPAGRMHGGLPLRSRG